MTKKKKVLIVEDSHLVSLAVQDILEDEGYDSDVAESGKEANAYLKRNTYQLILLDMMLPDSTGLELLKEWKTQYDNLTVVFMTAHGDIPTAVECLKAGAFDFLTKPVEKTLMLKTVKNAVEHSDMSNKVETLTQLNQKQSNYSAFDSIIGNSPALQKTLSIVDRVVKSDFSCLLIKGESGTGKGLFAHNVHKRGNRAKKPFVEVNCSALPATLIESELFGHTKGAFTDAKADKKGLFEMADGGTLFLDEIGDMDIGLQSKLLKVMEEQTFRAIGGTKDISVDVTIIAATNQNIEDLIEKELFREDLFYRLNVIPVIIPPLKERMEDIDALADYFLAFFSRKFKRDFRGFSKEVKSSLKSYIWPGNVREFRNVIERTCILTEGEFINDPEVLFPSGVNKKYQINHNESNPVEQSQNQEETAQVANKEISFKAMSLAEAEKLVIVSAMEDSKGNKGKAAKQLGVHRTTLYKKLEEYGIE